MRAFARLYAFFLAVGLLFLFPLKAEAKILISPDFEGTLVITSPDGKVQMFEEGEPLPDIPSGSSVEIFGGKMSISADADDTVSISCLGTDASVSGGSAAALSCGDTDGKLTATRGSIQISKKDGAPETLNEGEEYIIQTSTDDAENPATSEGEETGTPASQEDPPDSRSLESSLSA